MLRLTPRSYVNMFFTRPQGLWMVTRLRNPPDLVSIRFSKSRATFSVMSRSYLRHDLTRYSTKSKEEHWYRIFTEIGRESSYIFATYGSYTVSLASYTKCSFSRLTVFSFWIYLLIRSVSSSSARNASAYYKPSPQSCTQLKP